MRGVNTVLQAVLSEKAPYLIIACLSILGSLPGLFLPETAGVKMPDTLEDIKQFGKWVIGYHDC